jgi:LmbE family N-acetylglucosaminyl deacetylase
MRLLICTAAALTLASGPIAIGQGTARTLVTVWAHADDEIPVAPVMARYAREGVTVHMVIATDGSQGVANTSVPRGPEVAKLRADEARCSAKALGIESPILLGFPDGALGTISPDPALLFKLTQRVQEEVQRLRPDVLITWGPDGGTGHPDHRIISSIVTQLVRAGAPGVPQRLFYSSIPADGFAAMNPARGAPPFLIPHVSLFTTRVAFTEADLEATRQAMGCHRTQYPDEAVQRVTGAMRDVYKGELLLTSMTQPSPASDLFR